MSVNRHPPAAGARPPRNRASPFLATTCGLDTVMQNAYTSRSDVYDYKAY